MRSILRVEAVTVRSAVLVAALVGIAASACAVPGAAPAHDGRMNVVATTTILADMAKNVGGDRVSVTSIAPAGAEIEEYSPKPEDARHVSEASVIVVNGRKLESWADALLRSKRADALVVTLTDGLPDIDANPHLWFDVQLARRYVEKIRDAFAAADAPGGDAYRAAAARYDEQLVSLDRDLKARAADVPADRRKLVTSHDAFPYFAQAYGFEIVGFEQPQPGKDPSPAQLADLVQKVKAANVSVVFAESQASPRLAQTLAREAGITKIVSDIPTDSVQAPPADTYVGLMRTVMDRIVTALR